MFVGQLELELNLHKNLKFVGATFKLVDVVSNFFWI